MVAQACCHLEPGCLVCGARKLSFPSAGGVWLCRDRGDLTALAGVPPPAFRSQVRGVAQDGAGAARGLILQRVEEADWRHGGR